MIWLYKNQNHLLQCQNDVVMSLVERVSQGESLASWLDWLTEPLLCAGLWSWETYQPAEKGYNEPFQRPSEWVHQAVLCTAWEMQK